MHKETIVVHWFRRDLRLDDNTSLSAAAASGYKVLPVFIFDTMILEKLQDRDDGRVTFIHVQLNKINNESGRYHAGVAVYYGTPLECWKQITDQYLIKAVFCNEDYEPYARERDAVIAEYLQTQGISFHAYTDQVIFAKNDILKADGKPYTVFSAYSRRWHEKLKSEDISPRQHAETIYLKGKFTVPTLSDIGFNRSEIKVADAKLDENAIKQYEQQRDFPSEEGTTRLSVHLRFGTVSIREVVRMVTPFSFKLLNELCWREFYMMILWHFPHVENGAFKPEFNSVQWRNNEQEFNLWCEGKTGYPLVDAGMRELNATGYMHNRVRMVVASFLTKHLLIDWRWGEAYFAQKLLDFELSSNNGGWQWAAGTGCDAAPYFRIFNPDTQLKKFDPELKYVKKWLPEYGTNGYPLPIVDHKAARERCLKVYKQALNSIVT